MAEVRYARPGEPLAPPYAPGAFILTHGPVFVNKMIRFGEALRYRGDLRPYAYWSHAAVVVDEQGTLIQALTHGVSKGHISDYTAQPVAYVDVVQSEQDRTESVAFARQALGEGYGFLTIVAVALHALTGGRLVIGIDGTEICSGLVARCLERGPTIFTHHDPSNITPADLSRHFGVGRPLGW